MKVKLLLLSLFSLLVCLANAQLIQGTIKKGANSDQFEIWLKPDFSNSTQYLFQIGLPIAFPASASPQPTGINVVLDPSFTAAFGSNYSVTVNPVATASGGVEKYFNIVLVRGGAGASNPQNWTAGTEFKVLTGTFTYSSGSTTFSAKLADYQDGGSDGQGQYYTVSGNGDYYITSNSPGNFYASAGNSTVGGTSGAGYAQLMAAVNSGTVSGTSPLCIGATATYTSDGTAGGTWSSTNTSVATVSASTGLVTAVSAGTTDITYTISGVSSFKTLTVSPNVSAGTVSGTSPLCIGGTAPYTSNGTAGGTWSSSNTSVATVNASTGLVTAVAAGTANIIYTVNSGCGSPVSAQQSLTVNPNVSAGTVSGTSPLTVGGTATYTSNGTAGGTWSSSNTSVATVNASTGLVTAVAAGTANIIYTVNSGCGSPVSAQQSLTVNAPTNAGVVSGTSPLCIGATATYTSDGDAGGTWSSSNTSVATVNASTGLVTAVAAGTTDITYTVNGASSFKTLTVSPNVSAGTVSGTSPLTVGGTATYTSNGTAGGTWSSSNTSVATVNASTGLVTAVAAGTANIIYTVNSGCGSPVSAQQSLTVNAPTNAGVVSGTSPLCIGATATYTSDGDAGGTWSSTNTSVATVNASTGLVTAVAAGTTDITYTVNGASSFKTLTVNPNVSAGTVSGTSPLTVGATATYTSTGTAGGTWSSSNTAVATVDANSGLVTAVGAGTTNIIYTVNSGCGSPVSAQQSLTVNAPTNAGVVSGTSPLCIGATATYTSDGTAGGTWSSTNTAVATVDASTGLVTAVAAGTTDITYTVNGASSFKTLTVNANVTAGVVSGTTPLCIGATATYTSTGTAGGTWSSSRTTRATVDASTGLVTAVGPGAVNIIYTVTSGCGAPVSALKQLIVSANVNPGVLTGASPMCIGSTATYTTTGAVGGVWSSSNTAVATVNASTGLVTAVAAGTTTISYTLNSGCGSPASVQKTLTVNPNANAGVVSGTSPLTVGGTATYSSTGDAGGVWSSSNTSVAMVDASSGLVSAVGAGSATIIYTVNSGCSAPVSASASLTVSAVEQNQLIQGTIKPGAASGQVEVWLKPNFTNGSEYLFQIGLPIAFPASAATQPTGLNVTLDPAFEAAFGSNYSVTVNPVATNTGGTEQYFNIVLVRGGAGASDPQTWTSGSEFRVLTATFVPGGSPGTQVKLADYQDGGSDGQGNFYTVSGNGNYYVTNNSVGNFYAAPGLSTVGGDAQAGYAQTIATIGSVAGNAGVVSGTSPLCIGATATYTSDGTAGGTWSSTNTAVATVDASTGLVTAVAAGTTDITYTVNGASSFKTLTVNANVTAGVVSGTTPLCIGATATYTSTGTAGGTWSSSRTTRATVDASTGLVTAVGPGAVNIIYTVTSGCGAPVSALKQLIVSANVNPGVLTGASPMCIGSTATYTTTGAVGGVWSSSNTAVATVNASTGLVTAVAAGTTTISYTLNSGCGSPASVQKTLTVNPNANAGVVSGTSPLTVGGTATYSSTGDAGGVWSSSNTSVAMVDASSGLVSAVGAGSATIIYTVNSGCSAPVSASASLTVSAVEQNQLIQGTIKPGAASGQVEVWLKPNFTNGSEYLFQIGLPIAFPASAATQPTGLNVTLDPAFEAAFGSNYSVTVNPVATNTGGTEQYFNIVLVRGGAGASDPQTWTSGSEFRVLTATFVPGGSPGTQVKLADYQDGGSDGQGNFYTVSGNGNYYVTNNSVGNFYAAPGLSTVGGDAQAGYAQTIATIGGCESPVVEDITGNFEVCVGATTQLANATADGIWSSSDNSIATVDANGLVTGVAAGTATISYAVANSCGTTTVTATITVSALPVLTTQNLSGGGCSGGSIDLNNGITSNTDGLTVAFFSDAGFSNPISNMVNSAGTYYVSVTNAGGCIATGSIVVTVSDTQNPVVNCPGNVNTTSSSCSKSIAIANPTYSDNCSVASLTWTMSGATTGNSPATGINLVGTKVFNVGTTTITYTATDGAGNTATCSFTVKVTETTKPVIKCPASITQNSSSASCGADIAVGNPTVSDNCGVAIVSWVMTGATTDNSPTTGINYVGTHHFNVGTTTVAYTVKDASGNSATCSFTVKVVDKQAPVIDCPNDITEVVTTGCSKSITLPNPVYSDNCGISTVAWVMLGATNAISPLTGINTVGTKTFNVGVTYVTYAVKDVSGNIKTCTFKVTVVDNINPVVNCPGNISQSVTGKCSKSITTPNPTFSDNCKVSKLTWVMTGATTGSSSSTGINYVGTKNFNVGMTTITYTVRDNGGNIGTCSFSISLSNPKCSGNPGGRPHDDEDEGDNSLKLQVNPNPAFSFFNLRVLSESNENIEIIVYDVHGRIVEHMRGSIHQSYRFGEELSVGVYMVKVLQGDKKKVIRVIKQ